MKSEEIKQLLVSLKETSVTDKGIVITLQKIRSDAMATKGGVQRLVKLGCVPYVMKLLYRYLCMDKLETEAEKAVSENHINTALSIVANLLMEKEAREQVKRDGMETIVTLLENCSSEDVKIRCCRSLSNLAMDGPARAVMGKAKAAPALVKAVDIKYVEVEKPKDPEATESDAEENFEDCEDVDIETRFPSVGLVEAACKVLRYVFSDRGVCQQLVEEGIVARLAMLMKSEDSRMVALVLRTLSELWTKRNHRITENMASEFSRAGIMSKLIELIDSEEDKISQQSFTVLLPLAAHPQSAALIGAASGVDFCLSHLHSTRRHITQKEVVSCMSLLAKEAVNRVKLRESAGLKVFLETLQDDALADVHDRVISCLVSFLYDDNSLTFLLDNGLVAILLGHLQRCGNFASDFAVNLFKSAESLLKPVAKPTTNSAEESKGGCASDPSLERTVHESSDENVFKERSKLGSGRTQTEPAVHKTSLGASDHSDSSLAMEGLPEPQSPKSQTGPEAEDNSVTGVREDCEEQSEPGRAQNQTYSMNSPTYQAETSWRMEDYHPGVTCKSYHSALPPGSPAAQSDDSRASSLSPYSPLSMHSYFSPSHPAASSPRSSLTSSPPYSGAALSPIRSPTASDGCASPVSSERASSEDLAPVSPQLLALSPDHVPQQYFGTFPNSAAYGLVFSSSEDDDFADDVEPRDSSDTTDCTVGNDRTESARKVLFHLGEDENAEDQGSSTSIDKMTDGFAQDPGDIGDHTEIAQLTSTLSVQTGKRFFRLSDSDAEPLAKRQKLNRGAGVHASVTQNNILILLSRLSVRDDLSQHLASCRVLLCLTDHLTLADEPQDRCVRVLSRILTSPHCFLKLLQMCAPAVLVRTLMLDPNLKLMSHEVIAQIQQGLHHGGQVARHLSMQESETRSPSTGASSQARTASQKTPGSTSVLEDYCLSASSPGKSGSVRRQGSCDSSQSELLGSSGRVGVGGGQKGWLTVARVGSMLLRELSSQVLSPYGEGVVLHTFSCRSAPDQLMCAASLLFLHSNWPREGRRKLLIQREAVDKVLAGLCAPGSTADPVIKDVLGLALVSLSRGLHLAPRFLPADVPLLLNRAVQSIGPQAHPVEDSATVAGDGDGDWGAALGEGRGCMYSGAEKDLDIVVRQGDARHVLQARRQTLATNSSVFAAMLQGGYVESSQSQVSVSDVCPLGMTTLLHYLHCCDDRCPHVKALGSYGHWADSWGQRALSRQQGAGQTGRTFGGQSAPLKKKWLKHVLNVMAVADRYLLSELVHYLCAVVSTSLLDIGSCAEQVFHFAAFHGRLELAEDCVQVLLASPSLSVVETTSTLTTLAEGQFGSAFRAAVLALVKRGVANTP